MTSSEASKGCLFLLQHLHLLGERREGRSAHMKFVVLVLCFHQNNLEETLRYLNLCIFSLKPYLLSGALPALYSG